MAEDDVVPNNESFLLFLKGLKNTNQEIRTVVSCLCKMEKIVNAEEFQLNQHFFHQVMEVCIKYGLKENFEHFLSLMDQKGLKATPVTLDLSIRMCIGVEDLKGALFHYEKMIGMNYKISEITQGSFLSTCVKLGDMETTMALFDLL